MGNGCQPQPMSVVPWFLLHGFIGILWAWMLINIGVCLYRLPPSMARGNWSVAASLFLCGTVWTVFLALLARLDNWVLAYAHGMGGTGFYWIGGPLLALVLTGMYASRKPVHPGTSQAPPAPEAEFSLEGIDPDLLREGIENWSLDNMARWRQEFDEAMRQSGHCPPVGRPPAVEPPLDLIRSRMLAEMPDAIADDLLVGTLQNDFLSGSLPPDQMPLAVREWVKAWEAQWEEQRG